MEQPKDQTYNGYSNYQTWNVALHIQNDQWWYELARDYCQGFSAFRSMLRYEYNVVETPDEVALNDSALNIGELDEVIRGLKA